MKYQKTTAATLVTVVTLATAAPALAANEDRTRVVQLRDQVKKEKEFYRQSRQQFLDAQEKFGKMDDADADAEITASAKAHLERIIERMISKLERVQSWVEKRNGLSDEEKKNIIAELQENIDWLEKKKDSLEGATLAEIRAAAKEVKEYWRTHDAKVKAIIGKVLSARIDGVIAKAENVSERLENAIQKLAEDGTDVTKLKELHGNFDSEVANATDDATAAKQAFSEGSFRKGHQAIKEAHAHIVEARKIARELIRAIKEL